jgi:hypothetical protein
MQDQVVRVSLLSKSIIFRTYNKQGLATVAPSQQLRG